MKQKPWSIIVFSLLVGLIPLFSMLGNAFLINVNPLSYVQAFLSVKSGIQIAEFFLIFPLASLCIFLMKPWSYPVFLSAACWTVFRNVMTWQSDYQGDQRATMAFIVFTGGMVVLIGYYLAPQVRRAFFDQKSQWWERKRRFLVDTIAHLNEQGQKKPVQIKNFSESGALVLTEGPLAKGDTIALSVTLYKEEFPLAAKVVRKDAQEKDLYGLQFEVSADMKRRLTNAVEKLDASGVEHNQEFEQSFTDWVKNLPSGRGIVPEFASGASTDREGPSA